MHRIISNQLANCVQEKRITDFRHEMFYDGERPITYTISFKNIDYIVGTTVIEADATHLTLSNGYIVTFGYDNGGLRYYKDQSQIEVMKKDKKFITGGFLFQFIFNDNTCLVLTINSWTGSFNVNLKDEEKQNNKIDPTNSSEYIFDNFKEYFKSNTAVIAICATAKGFLKIDRNIVHEALYRCKIHPKTKAAKLSLKEINSFFNMIKIVCDEIISEGGIMGFIDLYGCKGRYKLNINLKATGKPCPVCGVKIEKGNAFGSSFFICPKCQVQKQ